MQSDVVTVQLEPVCDIQTASLRQATLIAAFRSHAEVHVDCARVEEVDLTLIQQLVAAGKTAAVDGKRLQFLSVSKSLRESLVRAGVAIPTCDPSFVAS